VRALLLALLAHEPGSRPTAAELEQICEGLAQDLPGPSLRQWGRERKWPEALSYPGDLVGITLEDSGTLLKQRALTEGGSGSSQDELEEEEPPLSAASIALWVSTVGVFLVMVATGSVTFLVLLGVIVYQLTARQGPEAPVEIPAPVIENGEASILGEHGTPEVVPPTPAPAVGTESGAASPRPKRGPTSPSPGSAEPQAPTPAPVEPEPVEPVPPPAAKGSVRVMGRIPLQLRREGRVVKIPGEVEVGTYEILADFGEGWVVSGACTVREERLTLKCSVFSRQCKVK